MFTAIFEERGANIDQVEWISILKTVAADVMELKAAMPTALIVGLVVFLITLAVKRKHCIWFGFAGFYISLVIYRCFLNRQSSESVVFDPQLFTTVQDVSGYHYYIDNVLLFIPMGAFAFRIWKRVVYSIGTCLLVSVLIETLQITTGLGSWHLDDLVANTIGGCISILIMSLIVSARGKT